MTEIQETIYRGRERGSHERGVYIPHSIPRAGEQQG